MPSNATIFEDAGLTRAEALVYQALLAAGRSRSGALIAATKLQSSVVFHALHSLRARGLVTTIAIGKRSEYSAAPPNTLLDELAQKKERFEAALPRLLAQNLKPAEEGAELYEGIAGLQNLFFSIADEAQTGDIVYYFDAEEHEHTDRAALVYLPFHARMRVKRVVVKGIHQTSSGTKTIYEHTADLRWTTAVLPPDTSIFRDQVIFVSWSDTPKAVRIRSKQLADQFLKLWDVHWRMAKE